jgi:hypothetical protein
MLRPKRGAEAPSLACWRPFPYTAGRGVLTSPAASLSESPRFPASPCTLNEPAPAFASAILACGLACSRKRAITDPVGQRPSPPLTLHFAPRRKSIPGSWPGHHVSHGQARSQALAAADLIGLSAIAGRGADANLTGQQLPRRSKGEGRPGRDHAPGQGTARPPRRQLPGSRCYPLPEAPTAALHYGAQPATPPAAWPMRPLSSVDRPRRERCDPPGLPLQHDESAHVGVGHRARVQR